MGLLKRGYALLKPFRIQFLVVFFSAMAIEGLSTISPYFFGKVIDSLFKGDSFSTVLLFVVLGAIIQVVDVVFSFFKNAYEIKNLDVLINKHLSVNALTKTLSFSLGQHKNEHSGVKQSVIERGTSSLQSVAYMITYETLPASLSVLFAMGAIFWLVPIVGAITVLGGTLYLFSFFWINKRFEKKIRKFHDMWDESTRLESEIIRNVEIVKTNVQEDRVIKEFDLHFSEIASNFRKIWNEFSIFNSGRNLASVIVKAVAMLVGSWLVFEKMVAPGVLVTLFFWLNSSFNRLSNLGRAHKKLLEAYPAIRKLFVMLDVQPDIKNAPGAIRHELNGKIEFRNVSFSYPVEHYISEETEGNEVAHAEVLSDISFVIEAGEKVAFVGESGAGKSTTAAMILRAYDPTKGAILMDGNDLKTLDIKYFLDQVGFVEQDVMLFDNTLSYNIKFPLNGRSEGFSPEEFERITEMARVDRFQKKLPKGYETMIGERGVRLSGGERQRVGVARALIKSPKILIFDEATSSLDTENEKEIRDAIERGSEGRTTIIIAHRFSTIKNVDKIIVFDKSRVVGVGNHDDLIQSCPEYGRFIKEQLV